MTFCDEVRRWLIWRRYKVDVRDCRWFFYPRVSHTCSLDGPFSVLVVCNPPRPASPPPSSAFPPSAALDSNSHPSASAPASQSASACASPSASLGLYPLAAACLCLCLCLCVSGAWSLGALMRLLARSLPDADASTKFFPPLAFWHQSTSTSTLRVASRRRHPAQSAKGRSRGRMQPSTVKSSQSVRRNATRKIRSVQKRLAKARSRGQGLMTT